MKKFAILLFCLSLPLHAAEKDFYPYSKSAGESYRKLPEAKKGGTIYTMIQGNPRTLVPILTADVDSTNVLQFMFPPLMQQDMDKGDEYFPCLAEKMEVTKDYKSVTYTLRKEAVWDDGTPVTADDAEFTFQVMMDVKADTAPIRANFDGYHFTKIDGRSFKFTIDNPNINTLVKIHDDFRLLQKKQFAPDTSLQKAKGIFSPVGYGPYKLKVYSRDQRIELERNKEWWGFKLPEYKNIFNFDTIVYRLIPDAALGYEKFIKGEIDVYELNSETFGTRVLGSDKDKIGNSPNSGKAMWATLQKSQMPPVYTYIGWNEKLPFFSSKKTRQALAMLIDYDQIIQKVYFGLQQRKASPFGMQTQNVALDQLKKAFKYSPPQALAMLKEDGWKDSDADGVLDRDVNGKKVKFEFTLRYNSENPMRAKVAQMVKEQFKKAGISVNVQSMEWNAYQKEIQSHNVDAFIMGWGKGYIHPDARQLFHTDSYKDGGSNYGAYSNPEVDKLIDLSNKEINAQKRYKLLQKIGALIYDDQPYGFVAELPGYLAAYSSKLKAARWSMKYDDRPAIWLFSQQ